MDATSQSGLLVLLGTIIGALSGVVGQLITASINKQSERRRLAIESGFREWQAMMDWARAQANANCNHRRTQ